MAVRRLEVGIILSAAGSTGPDFDKECQLQFGVSSEGTINENEEVGIMLCSSVGLIGQEFDNSVNSTLQMR